MDGHSAVSLTAPGVASEAFVAARPAGAVATARVRRDRASRAEVPWSTVLPLAVVLAFADGFWVISLRGAVGAIERTDDPFRTWLVESTLALPVFVFAVLAALTLALRWVGPVVRRPRAVVAVLLLVVAAATLVGVAALTASSAYDYHLQSGQLTLMQDMRGGCEGGCAARDATLDLHVKAVGYGSGILLVTNVVVAGWVVALRGGRLDTARQPRSRPRLVWPRLVRPRLVRPRLVRQARPLGRRPGERRRSREYDVRLVLAAGLVGAGVVHLAVVPAHLAEWPTAGVFFVLLAAAQLLAAPLVLVRPRPGAVAAGVVSLAPLGLWLLSRTAGLPVGPEAGVAEAVGLADGAVGVLELATLVASLVLLRSGGWLRRVRLPEHVVRLGLVAVVAVTAFGLAGSGVTWLDALNLNRDGATAHPVE